MSSSGRRKRSLVSTDAEEEDALSDSEDSDDDNDDDSAAIDALAAASDATLWQINPYTNYINTGHTFCRPAEGETNSSFYRNLNAVAQDHIAQDMRSIRQMYDGLRRLAVLLSKFMPWSAHLAMLEEYSVATENSPHVRTFLDWIAVAQLTKGPLIPRLTRNGKSLHVAHRKGHLRSGRENNNAEVYYTADGKLVHMSTSMLSNELSEMFKEGGYDTSKTHMLRKASIMWMARGGLSAAQIKAFSRHSDKSSSFYRYIQEGILESEMNTLDGGIDVIFSIWTPKPAAVANVMERQSN